MTDNMMVQAAAHARDSMAEDLAALRQAAEILGDDDVLWSVPGDLRIDAANAERGAKRALLSAISWRESDLFRRDQRVKQLQHENTEKTK
jgi:hypothetical protein